MINPGARVGLQGGAAADDGTGRRDRAAGVGDRHAHRRPGVRATAAAADDESPVVPGGDQRADRNQRIWVQPVADRTQVNWLLPAYSHSSELMTGGAP